MKRLWGVRHIRWAWLSIRVRAHAIECAKLGIGTGIPNKSDLDYLDKILKGEK